MITIVVANVFICLGRDRSLEPLSEAKQPQISPSIYQNNFMINIFCIVAVDMFIY
jgi:hypothetical protein